MALKKRRRRVHLPTEPNDHLPPPIPEPPSNHPPYAEMIYTAIEALKEKDDSSKRAIAKYIEQVYTQLPPNHSNLLTQHLTHLKSRGLLQMVKKSYALPRSVPVSVPGPAPTEGTSTVPTVVVAITTTPRPRGQPRKAQNPVQNSPLPQDTINVQVQQNAEPVWAALGLADEIGLCKLQIKSRLFEYLRLTTVGVIGASNRTPELLKMNPIGKVHFACSRLTT
ncbi:HMG-Y-related protein A [Glycine soja]